MGEISKIGNRQKKLQGHGRFVKSTPDVKPVEKMWPTPDDLGEGGRG